MAMIPNELHIKYLLECVPIDGILRLASGDLTNLMNFHETFTRAVPFLAGSERKSQSTVGRSSKNQRPGR